MLSRTKINTIICKYMSTVDYIDFQLIKGEQVQGDVIRFCIKDFIDRDFDLLGKLPMQNYRYVKYNLRYTNKIPT